MTVALTQLAAQVLNRLAPQLRTAVTTFLQEDFPAYAAQHEPVDILGTTGKFWVVQPVAGGDQLALVITQPHPDATKPAQPADDYVVAAVVPPGAQLPVEFRTEPQPTDFAVGADVLRSIRPASES